MRPDRSVNEYHVSLNDKFNSYAPEQNLPQFAWMLKDQPIELHEHLVRQAQTVKLEQKPLQPRCIKPHPGYKLVVIYFSDAISFAHDLQKIWSRH